MKNKDKNLKKKDKKIFYIEKNNDNMFIKLFILFYEFQINLKLHYYLTKRYNTHNIINNLYNKLSELINKYFEYYISIYDISKTPLYIENKININFNSDTSENDFIYYITHFINKINTVKNNTTSDNDSDIDIDIDMNMDIDMNNKYININKKNINNINIIITIIDDILLLSNRLLYLIKLE